jgi:hypothetical protein
MNDPNAEDSRIVFPSCVRNLPLLGFTLLELVSLVKVFRLFELEQIFFGVESLDIAGRCTTSYLLAGPACLYRWLIKYTRIFCPEWYMYKQKTLTMGQVAPCTMHV